MQHHQISFDRDLDEASSLIGITVATKWKVLCLVGVGGTGAVYAASHVNNGRKVALKVLHRSVAYSEDVRERLFEEAFAANRVDHPGTVAALDDGYLDDGRPYLVLELLEGENLNAMWERRGRELPLEEALHIGQAVLSIVAAAHEKGILHRDIKPENLFISADGNLKLLDFGIAKITDTQRSYRTRVGDAMGTPAFMPPEQARGRWEEVDERSDIWAVASTLFTLITGQFIHEGGTTNEILLSAMCHPAPPIRTVRPSVPEAVARVIDRGLSFEKAKRFASAREMYEAIGECFAEVPTSVSEPPPQSERRLISDPPPSAIETTRAAAPPCSDPALGEELVVPKKKIRKAAVFLAALVTVLGVVAWSGVSDYDVPSALLQQSDRIFAHLPWDPTVQADRGGSKTTGTLEGPTFATRVAFSEGGPAPAAIEVATARRTGTRYESAAFAFTMPQSRSDSDVLAETPDLSGESSDGDAIVGHEAVAQEPVGQETDAQEPGAQEPFVQDPTSQRFERAE